MGKSGARKFKRANETDSISDCGKLVVIVFDG